MRSSYIVHIYRFPGAEGDSLAQVDLFVDSRAVLLRSRNKTLVFTVNFEGTDWSVSRLVKFALNRRVRCGVHVDDVSRFIVAACGEVLAIRRHGHEKLVVKGVLLELISEVALEVVGDLGREDWLYSGGGVDDHARGCIAAHAHVPKLGTEIIATQNEMVRVGHKAGITHNIEPLVEARGLPLPQIEFERGAILEVRGLSEVADTNVTFVGRVEEVGASGCELC